MTLHKTLFFFIAFFILNLVLFTFFKEQNSFSKIQDSHQTKNLAQEIHETNQLILNQEKAYTHYVITPQSHTYQEVLNTYDLLLRYAQHLPSDDTTLKERLVHDSTLQQERLRTYGAHMSTSVLQQFDQTHHNVIQTLKTIASKRWEQYQKNVEVFKTRNGELENIYKLGLFFLAVFSIFILAVFLYQRHLYKVIKKSEEKLENLAYFDNLTQLPNRQSIEAALKHQIEKCRRKNKSFYLAQIDLDNFKKLNDSMGHDIGDALLIQIGTLLFQSIRSNDIVGRIGGDEFIIIFNEDLKDDKLLTILQRIFATLSRPIFIDPYTLSTSISMGIAMFPDDSKNDIELFKYADIAMYESKHKGRNQYQFFNHDLGERLRKEFALEHEIKMALKEQQFILHYQPKINASTSEVIGLEALVRWNHPQKGLLSPSNFAPFIEKGCCVKEFGEWVIKEVATQQQLWYADFGTMVAISLNLSVKHMMVPSFVEDMVTLKQKYNINLEYLSFEITEYSLMESRSSVIDGMKTLKNHGFKFMLDDFGTGYSSLTYLKEMPIYAIKIDKSFVDEIQPDSNRYLLLNAIISIARALELEIIAEGVEQNYQSDYLLRHGCHIMQGYYFAKPMSASEVKHYLFIIP